MVYDEHFQGSNKNHSSDKVTYVSMEAKKDAATTYFFLW